MHVTTIVASLIHGSEKMKIPNSNKNKDVNKYRYAVPSSLSFSYLTKRLIIRIVSSISLQLCDSLANINALLTSRYGSRDAIIVMIHNMS